MIAYCNLDIDTQPATSFSIVAKAIKDEVYKIQNCLRESCAIGLIGQGVFNQLDRVFQECAVSDWDGYNALPVEDTTYQNAIIFLESFPLSISPPEIGAEPDGHLTLEWYHSPRRILSISIAPDGFIHYAALMGTRKIYGSEKISSTVPKLLLDLIAEINPS